jgi:hypothetical protein
MSSSSETATIKIVPISISSPSLQLLASAHIHQRDQKEEDHCAYKDQIEH